MVRFELTMGYPIPSFQDGAIDRYATFPINLNLTFLIIIVKSSLLQNLTIFPRSLEYG